MCIKINHIRYSRRVEISIRNTISKRNTISFPLTQDTNTILYLSIFCRSLFIVRKLLHSVIRSNVRKRIQENVRKSMSIYTHLNVSRSLPGFRVNRRLLYTQVYLLAHITSSVYHNT